MQSEDAEYSGADGTGRARDTSQGLNHMLRDVRRYASPAPMSLPY